MGQQPAAAVVVGAVVLGAGLADRIGRPGRGCGVPGCCRAMTRNAALLERAEVFYDTNVGGKLAGYVEGNDRVERAWRTIESWVRPTPRRVLEIGCAIGDICWRMSRVWPEADIVGLDVSGKSVEI